jgi:hypothetical protein
VASPELNPDRKVLDAEGARQLQDLLWRLSSESQAIADEIGQHTRDLVQLKIDSGDWTPAEDRPSCGALAKPHQHDPSRWPRRYRKNA